MNILILGSGGREHALGWKLKQSPKCGELYFAPGNAGTAQLGTNLDINPEKVDTKTVDAIDYFCRHNDVSLVVIGPEDPLAHGMADRLAHESRAIFGPIAAAARLEGDKAFSKDVMRAAAVPTAESRAFKSADAALEYVNHHETPVVVKAAGLAKGKGVVVCDGPEDAADAVKQMMVDRVFGDAADTVVVEERLVGQEVSVLAIVDGRNIFVLEPAQDHKQAHEGDKGPNTGGMGAYTPTPLIDDKMMASIEREVLVPIVDALNRDGVEYKGVLYAGLMLTAGGPKVLEFNCRFGDPEAQVVLPRLENDLSDVAQAIVEGELRKLTITWSNETYVGVVMASGGYPETYQVGQEITGLTCLGSDTMVFHAGTKLAGDGRIISDGGRVLTVVGSGSDLTVARQHAYQTISNIHLDGAFYRKDIADI